ncbi:hypothetical protein GGS20DRAFT_329547 [Poronia punctata]|nr:hypothetical protein GGS20DRAFT_329547 [Poronia punctata]
MTDNGSYEKAAEDLSCYNCGMKGHIFLACPEDTRHVPAGLEASRKRQASGNEYNGSVKRGKGPVVTHYPPPLPPGVSHISPPPTTYGPPAGYNGYHLGPPPGLPPVPPPPPSLPPTRYEPYPVPNDGREASRFPYSRNAGTYDRHFHSSSRGTPPEDPYGPHHYDEYRQYRSGSPPRPPYGRSYPAPPSRHGELPPGLPQAPPYGLPPRPEPPSSYDHYPPGPEVDGYYPRPQPPYQAHPYSDGYPNPPHYGHDGSGVPAARPYPPSHGPPPRGNYLDPPSHYLPPELPPYHTRHDDRFTEWATFESRRREPDDRVERRPSNNRHNRERIPRWSRYDSPKSRGRSEHRMQDRPPKAFSSQNSTPPRKDSVGPPSSRSERPLNHGLPPKPVTAEESKVDDFSGENEMIFNEIPPKISRDLIREPLPAEWTDEPLMPPKYGKETIISKYVNPENIDAFAASIRETKAWEVMQHHPAMLPPGEIRKERIRIYEIAVRGETRSESPYLQIPGENIIDDNKQRSNDTNPIHRVDRQNRKLEHQGSSYRPNKDHTGFTHQRIGKNRRHDDRDYTGEREIDSYEPPRKRFKASPEPGEVCETNNQGSPSPKPKYASPWREREANTIRNGRHDRRERTPNASARNSRGSRGSRGSRDIFLDTRPNIGRRRRRSSPDRSSPTAPTRISRSRSPSRSPRRRSASGSPLTPTELALLGMMGGDSSDSENGSDTRPNTTPLPQPPSNNSTPKPRQKPATKLHAAYQRRW